MCIQHRDTMVRMTRKKALVFQELLLQQADSHETSNYTVKMELFSLNKEGLG